MNTSHTSPTAASVFIAAPADRPPQAPRRLRGVTLIELLTTIAILSVLLAGAAAGFSKVGASMRLSTFSNSFLAQMHLARSEAIKRNGRVVMCKSADGLACATGGGWEQGWMVFHDANNNGLRESHEPLIRRGEALPRGYRIAGNQAVSRYVSFSPFGGTRLTSGAFQAGTITVCKESGGPTEGRQVVINSVGRPRIQRATVPACEFV
jgi:type IV fimbrial biogenesis protein FimT